MYMKYKRACSQLHIGMPSHAQSLS